jgi:hypothetical protein
MRPRRILLPRQVTRRGERTDTDKDKAEEKIFFCLLICVATNTGNLRDLASPRLGHEAGGEAKAALEGGLGVVGVGFIHHFHEFIEQLLLFVGKSLAQCLAFMFKAGLTAQKARGRATGFHFVDITVPEVADCGGHFYLLSTHICVFHTHYITIEKFCQHNLVLFFNTNLC